LRRGGGPERERPGNPIAGGETLAQRPLDHFACGR
jgi:hypothetical protein